MLGGKRLRPALLLLSAKATGEIRPEHLTLAAVVEMIHTATLIHDDVLDDADQRRHLATVNARWNNETSVLLGDYLFTHSFYLASTTGSTTACSLIGRATNTVCEGELRQIGSRGNYSLSEADYVGIIQAKTAELCACRLSVGRAFSPVRTRQPSIAWLNLAMTWGLPSKLPMTYSMFWETSKQPENRSARTLEKQKPTLPLIRSLALANPAEREELIAILSGAEPPARDVLLPWFERFDAIDYARKKAVEYCGRARDCIGDLPASESQQILNLLTEFVVARSH